ncbi:MAG: hypothetical protein ACD_51C00206G0001 [uncultured bacterium]|nr:MAG: hypothetical protein ACD_51C00206G0001 [uncultured bacterium]
MFYLFLGNGAFFTRFPNTALDFFSVISFTSTVLFNNYEIRSFNTFKCSETMRTLLAFAPSASFFVVVRISRIYDFGILIMAFGTSHDLILMQGDCIRNQASFFRISISHPCDKILNGNMLNVSSDFSEFFGDLFVVLKVIIK